MGKEMQAISITRDHAIRIIETPVPNISASEVLVKPCSCGICGTDLHILRHGFPGTNYPVTPGHEFAGHVVALGRDVKNLCEGDFVAVDPNVVCGNCRWCKIGRPNLCLTLTPIGVGQTPQRVPHLPFIRTYDASMARSFPQTRDKLLV